MNEPWRISNRIKDFWLKADPIYRLSAHHSHCTDKLFVTHEANGYVYGFIEASTKPGRCGLSWKAKKKHVYPPRYRPVL